MMTKILFSYAYCFIFNAVFGNCKLASLMGRHHSRLQNSFQIQLKGQQRDVCGFLKT